MTVLTAVNDPADLATLFDRYARQLLGYCARRVGPAVAEDIVAETFLVAHGSWDRYDPGRAAALPWLYGIATNLIRRHRRAEVRAYKALARAAGPDSEDGLAQRAAERSDAAASRRRLAAALAGLPRRQRDVLLLYALADLEYAEIALALHIPVGTVRSALHRARTKVRAALAGDNDD